MSNKKSLGRIIADSNAQRYDAYRNRLDNFTRCMKRSARLCTLALRMFHGGKVTSGTMCMQEARYCAIEAGNAPEPQ